MAPVRRWTALAAILVAQMSAAMAHNTDPSHYHAPGPLEVAGSDVGLATGILVLNVIVWLLVLRAIWLHTDRAED